MFYVIFGILFIFFMTTCGSVIVCFSKSKDKKNNQSIFLSFAGGVMLAASFFSLIIPSFDYSDDININKVFPALFGVLFGALFILIFDVILSNKRKANYKNKKLFTAMMIHNIPEGLSVGLTFGLALSNYDNISIISSLIFALGIGFQNLPEGAALALPLYEESKNKKRAILLTILSGVVEPLFALLGLFLATKVMYLMPWALCFGAGSMIYVIVDELIIDSSSINEKRGINIAFIIGFLVMMILDLCL